MENESSGSRKKVFCFYTILVLVPLAFLLLFYMAQAAYKTAFIYNYIKTNQPGWKGNVLRTDPVLGLSPVPNSAGAHVLPAGPDIPVRFDENGFNDPMESRASAQPRPLVLALGCSFTYGYANPAKNAYPYLVGLSLNGTSRNAGVGAYGLSQMLLLAQKLLPIHKPDYLLVQYSDWLVDRAQDPFAPSHFGRIPVPFFYMKNDSFMLHPPVFLSKIFDLPTDRYRSTPQGWLDAISFYWYVGLPLSVHDDLHMMHYALNRKIGRIPEPSSSREELIKHVYKSIADEARKHGTKVVVVILGSEATYVAVDRQLFPSDTIVVNAQDALLKRLFEITPESYVLSYSLFRGSPPVLVDRHPNETAHRVIADAIVQAIQQAKMSN